MRVEAVYWDKWPLWDQGRVSLLTSEAERTLERRTGPFDYPPSRIPLKILDSTPERARPPGQTSPCDSPSASNHRPLFLSFDCRRYGPRNNEEGRTLRSAPIQMVTSSSSLGLR